MNSKIFISILFFTLSNFIGFSQQSMSDYSYIEVPEVYDFQDKKDEFQLNSITKFLFNKHGFHAYYSKDLPNVTKCDGLYADLETELGFIYTKIVIVIKDCNGVEVFRSAEGRSKLKEYSKTYNQALRNAFKSFEGLGVAQKDVVVEPRTATTVATKTKTKLAVSIATSGSTMPSSKFSTYTNDGNSFLLRKTTSGFSLFQEVMGADNDLVLLGAIRLQGDTVQFTSIAEEVSEASFDQNMNLTIFVPTGTKVYLFSAN